jgi:hypothetical protein
MESSPPRRAGQEDAVRKATFTFMTVAILSVGFAATAFAQESGTPAIITRLENTFGVTADQISALSADGLGYGEIAIVFSLASNMTDGITSANISQIMGLRQGTPPMGWGQIAKSLGLNLGAVVSDAASANGASHSANAGSHGNSSNANGHLASNPGRANGR